jgi:ATP-dependent Clp protease ATP-binding subunit ClpA
MWEPFTEPSRRVIVRAQEVAQMFSSHFIGTEHIAFALAEGDNEVGRIFAGAIDRGAIRERLGEVSSAPVVEMVFTGGAKRAIETAFENARRLNHNYIGLAHLALGILDSGDTPPLVAGTDVGQVREELNRAAIADAPASKMWTLESFMSPETPVAKNVQLAADAMIQALHHFTELSEPGTRVTITFSRRGKEQSWTWKPSKENG